MAVQVDGAMKFIVDVMRNGHPQIVYSNFGYDLYLTNVILEFLRRAGQYQAGPLPGQQLEQHSPAFYAAAWELCRRGILRPGVTQLGRQITDDGTGGAGFSVTPAGRAWLQQGGQQEFFAADPERFSQLLAPMKNRFGLGFFQRGQEAFRCHFALAYLACCAMCGAAAESILLAAAIAKTGDEGAVLKAYSTSGGRKRVQDILTGQAPRELAQPFGNMMGLLSYWRDDAAHGG